VSSCGAAVDNAQRAQRVPLQDERRARVEADAQVTGDEFIVRKACVLGCVGHHQELRLIQDGVRAKREAARRLRGIQTDARFEPLAGFIDQRDERDGSAANPRGEEGEVVEGRVGRCVENTGFREEREALGFIRRDRVTKISAHFER